MPFGGVVGAAERLTADVNAAHRVYSHRHPTSYKHNLLELFDSNLNSGSSDKG